MGTIEANDVVVTRDGEREEERRRGINRSHMVTSRKGRVVFADVGNSRPLRDFSDIGDDAIDGSAVSQSRSLHASAPKQSRARPGARSGVR